MRYGEMIHLEWADIDFDNDFIKIQPKVDWTTKSHQSRVIPMHPEVKQMLVERFKQKKELRVFIGETIDSFHHRLVRFSKLLGMKGISPHVLRHTCASHLVMRGVDLPTIKQILGHSDIKTTMIYAHLAQDHVKYALSKLDFFSEKKELKPIRFPKEKTGDVAI